jgi:energy-coupling factor transporter ATP-binding protein EcfA2
LRRLSKKSLETVSLTGFETRNVETLSAGQTHRLAIASVLSTSPEMLLLDEPTAQLDASGKKRLTAFLSEMKSSGCTLLIADHELGPFESLADRVVLLDQGRIQRIDLKIPEEFVLLQPGRRDETPDRGKEILTPLISVKEAYFCPGVMDGRCLIT